MFKEIGEVLLCKGNVLRWTCFMFCILFTSTSFVIWLLVFLAPSTLAWMTCSEALSKAEVICVCVFTAVKVTSCVFIVSNLRMENQHGILFWTFVHLAIWHVPFVGMFMNLVYYVTGSTKRIHFLEPLVRALPLMAYQCVWLSFIITLWYYWRQLSSQPDVPSYVRHLRMNAYKRKVARKNRKERLGNEQPKFLVNLDVPSRSIAAADGQ